MFRHCEKYALHKASSDPRGSAHICVRMHMGEKALEYHTTLQGTGVADRHCLRGSQSLEGLHGYHFSCTAGTRQSRVVCVQSWLVCPSYHAFLLFKVTLSLEARKVFELLAWLGPLPRVTHCEAHTHAHNPNPWCAVALAM